ncbi:uncharacterized protein LOC128751363 [Synchiropus splendidus]|uniref:uncharacterized protein LOC128751363 n=1 Tax=Synchiropus splendidus TaxID=270530 RepID=UPI00237D55C1|nr:uncharacterized protein LOC128751363 [Synchiropus splendidus]
MNSSLPLCSYWGRGTTVTVTSDAIKAPTVFPVLPCDTGSGDITLTCLATGFTPSSLTFAWTKGDTAITDIIQYPTIQNRNDFTGISQVKVRRQDWDSKEYFYCKTTHNGEEDIKSFQRQEVFYNLPTLKLVASSQASSHEAFFACFANDFSPNTFEFKWLKDDAEITSSKTEITTASKVKDRQDGKVYSAASFLTVESSEWSGNAKFTCEFKGKGEIGDQYVNASVTHMAASPIANDCREKEQRDLHIEIIPPEPENLLIQKKGSLICDVYINKKGVTHIFWKDMAGYSVRPEQDKTGKISLPMDITFDEWTAGVHHTCVVQHSELPELTKEYTKRAEKQNRPAVFMFPPVEQSQTGMVTLTCFVKDFFPEDIIITWLVDDVPADPAFYQSSTTKPVLNNGLYSAYSQLSFNVDQWNSSGVEYSCVVYHESVVNTTKSIVRSIGSKSFEKVNMVNLNMNLADRCKTQFPVCGLQCKCSTARSLGQDCIYLHPPLPHHPHVQHRHHCDKEERILPPRITLLPIREGKSDNSAVRLLCTLSDFFPNTLSVEWQRDGQQLSDVKVVEKKYQSVGGHPKTFSLSSEIEPDMSKWNNGSTFTCISTQKKQEFKETASICGTHRDASPTIHVQIPSFQTGMTGYSDVTATCSVQTTLAVTVIWMMDGKQPMSNQVSQATNSSHVISNLSVSIDGWRDLKQLKCVANHPCFTMKEETVTVAGTTPSVEIRRSLSDFLKGDAAVLECAVNGLSSIDAYISIKANGLEIADKQFLNLPQSSDLHSITRRFKVSEGHWDRSSTFTCSVNQGFSDSFHSEPTGRIFEDPSVELLLVPSAESGPQRLFCTGQGFNPHIKWFSNSQEKQPSTYDISVCSDGRMKVTSEVRIIQTEWESGETFTCEVADKSLSKTNKSTVSICSVTPPSSQLVGVYVWGPSQQENDNQGPVMVTCLLAGYELNGFSITWKVDGSDLSHKSKLEPPVKHRNGTVTQQSFLNVSKVKWDAHKQVSCKAKHKCSTEGHEEFISKSKDLRPPTVTIIPPSPSELSEIIPLVCQVSGFFPPDILVYWEKDGERAPLTAFTNSPAWRYTATDTYTVISRFNASRAEDHESNYSCVARHDSSRKPSRDSIRDIFASLSHTKPTAALLQGPGELVCLVSGFSPASIDITWTYDGTKELLGFNTSEPIRGPDGKYSIQSRLRLSPAYWLPGAVHTCKVEHVTSTLVLNVSRPATMQDCDFMDGLANLVVSQDLGGEAWYTSLAFLILFILSTIYAVVTTIIKII